MKPMQWKVLSEAEVQQIHDLAHSIDKHGLNSLF